MKNQTLTSNYINKLKEKIEFYMWVQQLENDKEFQMMSLDYNLYGHNRKNKSTKTLTNQRNVL